MKTVDVKLQKVACREHLCALDVCMMESNKRFGEYILHCATHIIDRVQHSDKIEWTVNYPASWWQHFKQDVMPKWFVKRYPVKLKTERKEYVADLSLVKVADYEMLKNLGPNPVFVRVINRPANPQVHSFTQAGILS